MVANSGGVPYESIDAVTLAKRLTAGDMLQLIDVREPEEVAIAAVQGFEILPLSQFAEWSSQIHSRFEADKETIVMCHHGIRSAQMCYWLAQNGFTRLKNLEGGIDAYAAMVDPLINRY